MIIVQICVGSSCHLKGSAEIVELLENKIKENNLGEEIVLTGRFCAGKCNRLGVTVTVNDEDCVGITPQNFNEFWNGKILPALKA